MNEILDLVSSKKIALNSDFQIFSFEEVKKELDTDQIIQVDAYDRNETAPIGSEENSGHSLSIVGYILPADGDTTKHAPYYEVWNPWWGNTVYISSKAEYFNLEGTQYKWGHTWHTWHKEAAETDSKITPAIAQQKVASESNPMIPNVKLLSQNRALKASVSEMQAPVKYRSIFGADFETYSYRASTPQAGKRRIMIATTVLNNSEKIYYDSDEAERWRKDINEGNRIDRELINDAKSVALSSALLLIGAAICKGMASSATRIDKIRNAIGYVCSGFGIVGSNNIFDIARTISDFYDNGNNLVNDWWDVQMA
ncbi:hypothetical protein [Lactococcus taiwanensis]|uniref:hypothetical protein n=1 Tax=Lactococcus taiwanensis TaxID=1151742 RepID=UPI0028AE9F5B|nr:hypothetical protein [Lactococcus taiwanensis]